MSTLFWSRSKIFLGVAVLGCLAAGLVPFMARAESEQGEGGSMIAAPANAVFEKECAACHMAFPAAMLPTASWKAIMGGLKDHFGENAALDDKTAKTIEDYLLANAADAGGQASWAMRGIDPANPPLRITETKWWIGAHSELSSKAFKKAKVGSKTNCVACHQGAAQGVFGD